MSQLVATVDRLEFDDAHVVSYCVIKQIQLIQVFGAFVSRMIGLSDVLTDSSAKCYYTIECTDNMANNLNGEDISISVNVRLNKSEASRETTEDVADVDTDSKDTHDIDDCSKEPSIEAIVDKCLSIHDLFKMKNKSKQVLIAVILGVVATLMVALHTGSVHLTHTTSLCCHSIVPVL